MNKTVDQERTTQRTSALAIWSFILGLPIIIGFLMRGGVVLQIGCLTAIPAVICGHFALHKIKKSTGALTGKYLAFAGLVMGYIGVIWLIIVTVSTPKIFKLRNEALVAATEGNLGVTHTTLTFYRLATGTYPSSLQALITNIDRSSKWAGPYILDEDMLKDFWGNELVYIYPGILNPDEYDLKSLGPDGVESNDDIVYKSQ